MHPRSAHRPALFAGALALGLLLALGGALAAPQPAQAAALTVTDPGDDPQTTVGSLRWAVANAAPGDTIGFDPAVTALSLGAPVVLPVGVTIDGGDHVSLMPASGMTDSLLTIAPSAPDQDYTIQHIELVGAPVAVSRGLLVVAPADPARNVTVAHATLSGFRNDTGSAIDVQQIAGVFTVDASTIQSNLATGAGGAAIADTSATGAAIVISNTTIAGNITASGTSSDGAVSIAGNAAAPISFTGDTIESNVVGGGSSVFGAGISLGSDGGPIGDVTISGSTFSDNGDDSAGGRVAPYGGGGAYIGYAASVTISATGFELNTAEQAGGGLLLDSIAGDVHLDRDTFDRNVASAAGGGGGGSTGGGLFAGGTSGTFTATGLLVENNSADGWGGGILLVAGGAFHVGGSTFTGNTGSTGAAMFVDEVADDSTVSGSTFSGNTSNGASGVGLAGGSGLFALQVAPAASLLVETSTFSANSYDPPPGLPCGCAIGLSVEVLDAAGSVGIAESTFDETASAQPANAIQVGEIESSGTFGLTNSTVVADRGVDLGDLENTGVARVSHTIVQTPSGTDAITVDGVAASLDVRWSLLSSGLGANETDTVGNQLNTDALLASLADNGGPTTTMLPEAGSPALDAGDPAFGDPVTVDQRGLPRIVRVIDIGAVEVQASAPTQATAPAQLAATGAPIGGEVAAVLLLLLLGGAALGLRRRRIS